MNELCATCVFSFNCSKEDIEKVEHTGVCGLFKDYEDYFFDYFLEILKKCFM